MPLLPLLFVLCLPLLVVVAMPFSLLQRYRMGKARRMARGWVTTLNLVLMIFGTTVFIWSAALTNFWVPRAFSSSLLGILAGGALGFVGLALTRWEETPRGLHYTPNRWLVLLITIVVAARILYGMARAWQAWSARAETPWLAASGLAGSLGVGAAVLGYYLVYTAGVRRWINRRGLGR